MTKSVEEILSGSEPAREQSVNTAEPATEAPQEAESGRARDDKGRFASPRPEPAEGEAAQPAVTEQPPPQPVVDPDSKGWRYEAYKDEKEKRQKAQARAQTLERENFAYRQRLAEKEKQASAPDMFADPDGYNTYRDQSIDEKLRKQEANFSFRLAHRDHKEVFDNAFQEMIGRAQNGDRSVVRSVMESTDPGETLVRWFKRDQITKEVGDDPVAYREKVRAEVLAEQNQPTAKQPVANGPMPSNLAAVRSVGSRSGPQWGGPAPIPDIFDRRAKRLKA